MDRVAIYALEDPRTNEIRYIGRSKEPKRRIYMEIYKAHQRIGQQPHLDAWLCSLMAKDLRPIQVILEWVDEDTWPDRERYWISCFENLTNHSAGGEATKGFQNGRHSIEFRNRQSERMRGAGNPMYGVTSPMRGKPAANRGVASSVSTRAKQSAWHRQHPAPFYPETREKLRHAKQGEAHHNARLREEDVFEIRRLRELGLEYRLLSLVFRVSKRHIRAIIHRRRWMHI